MLMPYEGVACPGLCWALHGHAETVHGYVQQYFRVLQKKSTSSIFHVAAANTVSFLGYSL